MDFAMRIEWIGTDQCRRYVINRGDDVFWAGEYMTSKWTIDIKHALKFARHQDACHEMKNLIDAHFSGLSVREFTITMQVKVYSRHEYSLNELREYLSSALTIVQVPDVVGYGPVPGSMVQVLVPWDNLVERYVVSQFPVSLER